MNYEANWLAGIQRDANVFNPYYDDIANQMRAAAPIYNAAANQLIQAVGNYVQQQNLNLVWNQYNQQWAPPPPPFLQNPIFQQYAPYAQGVQPVRLQLFVGGQPEAGQPQYGQEGEYEEEEEEVAEGPGVKSECPVCYDTYKVNSYPKIGLCGHSICLSCEQRLGTTRCPFCNTDQAFRNSKRNFLAEQLIAEIFENKEKNEEELRKKDEEFVQERARLAHLLEQLTTLKQEVDESKAIQNNAAGIPEIHPLIQRGFKRKLYLVDGGPLEENEEIPAAKRSIYNQLEDRSIKQEAEEEDKTSENEEAAVEDN